MNISAKKVKMLREERGWSQEHLGDVAGLSYRTIQRIERNGQCSLESKMAVASAFLVSPVELADDFNEDIGSGKLQWGGLVGITACLSLIVMALLMGGGILMAVDVPSILIALLLPISLSMVSNGASLTWQALRLIGWMFYEPSKSQNIHASLPVLRKFIIYCYSAGVVSSLLALLSSINYFNDMTKVQLANSIQVVLLALIYGVLLAEIVFRPVHHKICRLLLAKAQS